MVKWPRGRYNGQRIVGFEIKFIFDVSYWRVRLLRGWVRGLILGPLRWYMTLRYKTD